MSSWRGRRQCVASRPPGSGCCLRVPAAYHKGEENQWATTTTHSSSCEELGAFNKIRFTKTSNHSLHIVERRSNKKYWHISKKQWRFSNTRMGSQSVQIKCPLQQEAKAVFEQTRTQSLLSLTSLTAMHDSQIELEFLWPAHNALRVK